MFHVEAEMRCKADAETSLEQILENVPEDVTPNTRILNRAQDLKDYSVQRLARLDTLELALPTGDTKTPSVPNILRALRTSIPFHDRTLILNEAISNYPLVWEHMCPEYAGMMFSSGSSGLGWGLGAAIGASLALKTANEPGRDLDLVVLIVGDGSFLFGVPSSAFWIARRYNTVRLSPTKY